MTCFSEKMMISYTCMRGFMPKLQKKSWIVSTGEILVPYLLPCIDQILNNKSANNVDQIEEKKKNEDHNSNTSFTEFNTSISHCQFYVWN